MSKESDEEQATLEVDIKKKFVLKKPIRGLILTLLFLSVMAVNMTMRIFALTSKAIKATLELSDVHFASFGTVFSFGNFASAIFLMIVFRNPDRKLTILSCLYICGGLLLLFRFVTNAIILLPSQFFIGFCSFTINIYIIIWIDQFGMFFYKTLFLTMIGLFKALGIVASTILNHLLGEEKFQTQFMIQALIVLALAVALSFFNKMYFSSRIYLYKANTYDDQSLVWKERTRKNVPEDETEGFEKYDSIYRYRKSDNSTAHMTPPEIVWGALTNRIYFMGLLASAVLTTASFAFNLYVVEYFNTVFGYVTKADKLWTLCIVMISGPLGASIINFIVALLVGGYHHKSTCVFMFCNYALATIAGNLIPSMTSYKLVVLVSSLFFLGSASVTPFLQGTNFSGGTLSRKPFGIITANLWGTVFGAIPAPIIYAYLMKHFDNDKIKTLSYFMKYLWIGLIFDFIMMCFKLTTFKKKPAPKDDKAQELVEIKK